MLAGAEDRPMTIDEKYVWASAEAYASYVGRWSRLVAREFVAWLGIEPRRIWLDIGCGTGALSEMIIETQPG
jgi:ubiquinone/menaquinone biosynthesis C-methylase UbiE